MKYINCTPHDITLCANESGYPSQVFPRSGFIARVEETKTPADIGEGVPVATISYGKVTGLPDKGLHLWRDVPSPFDVTICQICDEKPHETEDGCKTPVRFIVSLLVAQTSDRDDLVIVADTIRNKEGQIIGCMGFARLQKSKPCALCSAKAGEDHDDLCQAKFSEAR